ncbi:MAG: NAD(P)/FAD-dependent oxidoreductase [Lachnospiraceae bacterium]|jgi:predicted Rossmann fold flavoprotein|nr:NAD(P)/FAD-dependent oxidoreductase [Lachnospiraceae bacterium]
MKEKILVAGGGASGMMAAVLLARKGHSVHVFEQNEKLGKKLYITGKGRCNLTNACETMEELMGAVVTNPKFLYSSFYQFDNHQVMDFFEELGVPLKVERGGRVFPKSDKSSDVIRALERQMKKLDVKIHLKSRVEKLLLRKEEASGGQLHIRGIQLENKTVVEGDRVLVASGGMSYPSTGADGSGYRFARSVGHEVVKPVPSLVPLLVQEGYVRHLQGLSLRNIQFSIWDDKKCLYREFGELLFTHQGISGPVVLSASAAIGRRLRESPLTGKIDLKPALSEAQLDARILREFENNPQKQLKNVIGALYPASLTPVAIRLSGISPGKPVSTVSRQERQRLLEITKAFPMTIMGAGSFKEAIITKGGISVREIHPSTMESKLVSGLYFIGEVLDLDAMTGGFNLQIAWSTAWAAANA